MNLQLLAALVQVAIRYIEKELIKTTVNIMAQASDPASVTGFTFGLPSSGDEGKDEILKLAAKFMVEVDFPKKGIKAKYKTDPATFYDKSNVLFEFELGVCEGEPEVIEEVVG